MNRRSSGRIKKRKAKDTPPIRVPGPKIVKSPMNPVVSQSLQTVHIASFPQGTKCRSINERQVTKVTNDSYNFSAKIPILNFDDLTRDAILMVFSNLTPQDITRSVLPVCKTWYNIGRDPILWQRVVMNLSYPSLSHKLLIPSIIKVVQNATLLRYFHILINRDISAVLQCIGKSCPLLETLFLTNGSVEKKKAVQTLVSGCPLLKHLIWSEMTGSALEEFGKLTSLVRLDIINVGHLPENFLCLLSRNSKNLEEIYMRGNDGLQDKHMVPFLKNLAKVSNLYFVDPLPRCTSDTFQAIAQCTTLKSLYIHNAQMLCDEDMKTLENLPTLNTITLRNAWDVGSSAWVSFITNLDSSNIIRASFIGCPNIDASLEDVLFDCPDTILQRAASINLNACDNVTDRLVELILFGNPALEMLCVNNKGFHGDILNTLDPYFAPKLRVLDLPFRFYTNLPHFDEFLKNRPNLVTYATVKVHNRLPQRLLADPDLPEWVKYLQC